jgi:hypothetical protein
VHVKAAAAAQTEVNKSEFDKEKLFIKLRELPNFINEFFLL